MNGFLVTARFSMDDTPLRLFTTYSDAVDYVRHFSETSVSFRKDLDSAIDVQGYDPSDFVCLAVTEFQAGTPTKCMLAKEII